MNLDGRMDVEVAHSLTHLFLQYDEAGGYYPDHSDPKMLNFLSSHDDLDHAAFVIPKYIANG